MATAIYFVSLILVCQGHVYHSIVKRDNGAAFSDVGGPVAESTAPDISGNQLDPELQNLVGSMQPCETNSRTDSIRERNYLESFETLHFYRQQKQFKANKFRENGQASKQNGRHPFRGISGREPIADSSADDNDPSDNVEEHFQEFSKKFNKKYASKNHQETAFQKFKENFKTIRKMSSKRVSPYDASFSFTKFSDNDFNTFRNHHLGALAPLDNVEKIPSSLVVKRNCPKLSWNQLGVVPDVRQQDNCGCCYAMSTADMIGAQYQIDNQSFKKSLKLSSQWISDCMPEPAGYKCNGGRPAKVLETLAKNDKWKIPSEDCYPYEDKNQTCTLSKTCSDSPTIKVNSGKLIDASGTNEKEIMAALLQHGPVVAIVEVNESWQLYNGTGIIRPYQCSTDQLNHAVLITGYNFESCVPYYLIKNSWGQEWGGNGYVKLEAGKNTCGVAKSVTFTCTKDNCSTDPVKYVLSTMQYPECSK